MISAIERAEIVQAGQADGQRLFAVATVIYKGLIILNYILAVIGGLVGLGMIEGAMRADYGGGMMFFMAVGVLVGTAIACAINYAAAVLSTHVAKVLVHILFANLAIMDSKENA